jgi:tetratricopeptide (TPR) repeat protein
LLRRVAQLEMDVRRVRLNDRLVRRLLLAFAVVGALVAVGVRRLRQPTPQSECADAAHEADIGFALIVCQRVHAETADPFAGALLANVLRRSEKLDDASKLANRLLGTAARADALQVLGKIAIAERQLDRARSALVNARALHLGERRMREVAVDDHALATLFRLQNRFGEVLRALDDGITEARLAHDPVIEGYCHMLAGQVLGEVGYFDRARKELDLAAASLVLSRDLADVEIARGALEQRNGFGPMSRRHNEQAVLAFEQAIAHATVASLARVRRKAELELIYSLAELGRTDQAAQHLEIARQLDVDDRDKDDREELEARIAYRRGDLVRASELNTRRYDHSTEADRSDDFALRLCIMQAQIGIATHDLSATELWATRGIAVVEAMRREQSALELRPWMLSLRRQPYEILFAALANAGRFDDAVVVFDGWQGRTLLDAVARTKATQPASLRAVASHTETMERLLPSLSTAPLAKPLERDRLLATLRGVDLVVLLVADEEVWRITAHHGALAMVNLGTFAAVRPRLDQLMTTPTRTELADQLGVELLGNDGFRETPETLYVLLDGPIAGLPVAALRAHGKPLIAMRPLVRASRLSELACVARPPGAVRANVLADALGNLPEARREAQAIAQRFGVTARLGAAATHDALFASSNSDLLHVAVHAGVAPDGGALAMSDQPVSALEIAAHRGWPALVVLSACASAAADDGELATSLATAFLASGSTQVVATLRPVSDAGASEITNAFYRANGAGDPARALARAQAQLAKTSNVDWPNFVLFGHDICRKDLE